MNCAFNIFVVILLGCRAVAQETTDTCSNTEEYAVCNLVANPSRPSNISGIIKFYQSVETNCTNELLAIDVYIENVPTDDKSLKHGFHVHEMGDMTEGCESMGGHYNPHGAPHGHGQLPKNQRHVGDLGNVEQKSGNSTIIMRLYDYLARLNGPESIIGRGIVLHAGEDDLGLKDNPGSKATGNAGARLACCVIARSKPFPLT